MSNYRKKNLRDMTIMPGQGKDAKESSQLTGLAHKTQAFQAKNETTEYETGSTEKGPLGGMNTNS